MEIEKVIRILAVCIAVASLALCIASRVMFPDASPISNLPLLVVMILSLGNIWRDTLHTKKQNKNSK